jgi:preprotein translocase subunit SecB
MSDTSGAGTPAPNGQAGAPQQTAGLQPQLQVLAQYIKDLSFENPQAPQSLQMGKPALDVSVDVQARPIGVDQFEVILRIRADANIAQAANQKVFVTELTYGGVFMMRGIPQEGIQPILLIECPRILFPFARQIVANITQAGGYPPLLLDPIDFAGLFRAQLQAQAQQGAGASQQA